MDVCTSVSEPSTLNTLSEADRNAIDQQNNEIINKMTPAEIEEERQKLLKNLDPSLVEFLKKKQLKKTEKHPINKSTLSESLENAPPVINFDTNEPPEAANEVLKHPLSHTWIHFDNCESEKLKWTTDVAAPKTKLKPGETYEARFDFAGALLEYVPEGNQPRELYHHGEEPHRPGYSMKELFKLTRSQIQQQRIIALNCLAGILENYMVGNYWFLDLPLAKIFFVIRFALDDNATSALHPALRAMRSFFFHHIDESCLDSTVFLDDLKQPLLSPLTKTRQNTKESRNDQDLINYIPEKNEEDEMTDYHIAENDIVQCALRTDILPRIRYILSTIRPNLNTVEYCLQILIRLARESIAEVDQILKCEGVVEIIVNEFLPNSSQHIGRSDIAYGTPVILALKLIRIMASHSATIANDIYTRYFKVIIAIQCYMSAVIEVNPSTVTLQIEAMNTWAVFLSYGIAQQEFCGMFPIIMRQMDYHVRATHIIENSYTLLHSHGAALLSLISQSQIAVQFVPILVSGLCNWSQQIVRLNEFSSGHLRLITSAYNTLSNILSKRNMQNAYNLQEIKMLNEKYIKQMIQSNGFERLCNDICENSNLLSNVTEIERPRPCATQIGACTPQCKNLLTPILCAKSPIIFLASLTRYILTTENHEACQVLLNNRSIQSYLKNIATSQLHMISHWYTRIEYALLTNMLKFSSLKVIMERNIIFPIAYKLSYLLSQEFQKELLFIMREIIFNKNYFPEERRLENINLENELNLLDNLKDTCECYISVLGLDQYPTNNLSLSDWNHSILPLDWTYMPILGFYSSSQDHEKGNNAKEDQQKDIIKCCLQWLIISESYIPEQASHMSSTDRFCRLLCVFLCHNSLFLDQEIKPLLAKSISKIFQIVPTQPFDFNKPLQGLSSFTDLYTKLLEHYQAVSYGDEMFSACVLVPLAHCHDICWRKQIWSEHSGLLRVLNCPEEKLCYPLQAYLEPVEKDESLLLCYKRALHGLLRPNTIPHKIASYHVKNAKTQR
ncbi:RNA polymerase II-associated protein 1-like [Ctenocephalides felis]|uniref:RNA polymerase II-associated protein 1-like n=1 Tax=Ctenocephalides felis TaxID=7515 RepID=UPI000E6E430A|nr:RNA polymerase II-associated protein 1-like [Ctenocephalides felis]